MLGSRVRAPEGPPKNGFTICEAVFFLLFSFAGGPELPAQQVLQVRHMGIELHDLGVHLIDFRTLVQ